MTIDVLTVVHRNYGLLDLQRKHWRRRIRGRVRLLVADNTPVEARGECGADVVLDQTSGYDGESHGAALDVLVARSDSEVFGVVDTDFFWTRPDILQEVEARMLGSEPLVALGCGGFYRDFQNVMDQMYPARAGVLAPICWGMFLRRDFFDANHLTFVVHPQERAETGWRVRQALIDMDAPRLTLAGYEDLLDPQLYWFGEEASYPWGFHLLKGSTWRSDKTSDVPKLIRRGMAPWAERTRG